MQSEEVEYLLLAIDLARRARAHGDHPFGAVLVDAEGRVLLEAENTQARERDPTGHAELKLIRAAAQRLSPDVIAHATLYASTEPCAMCAGAIVWGGVRRVVYALASEELWQLVGPTQAVFRLPCRDVFEGATPPVEVVGPVELQEARDVHRGFWNREGRGPSPRSPSQGASG